MGLINKFKIRFRIWKKWRSGLIGTYIYDFLVLLGFRKSISFEIVKGYEMQRYIVHDGRLYEYNVEPYRYFRIKRYRDGNFYDMGDLNSVNVDKELAMLRLYADSEEITN